MLASPLTYFVLHLSSFHLTSLLERPGENWTKCILCCLIIKLLLLLLIIIGVSMVTMLVVVLIIIVVTALVVVVVVVVVVWAEDHPGHHWLIVSANNCMDHSLCSTATVHEHPF